MKFVCCEDDSSFIDFLTDAITTWGKLRGETISILSYHSAEALLFKTEEWRDADGLILDIELREMNGMDLALEVRKTDAKMPLLFITGYEKFVFEGYEVGAVSYLLKPVNLDKLYRALDKIREENQYNRESILAGTGDAMSVIYLRDILYIESDKHYSLIQTATDRIKDRRGISELSAELQERGFCMSHRSYLINPEHIRKVSKTEVSLDGGFVVPVARGKWEQVNQACLAYLKKDHKWTI